MNDGPRILIADKFGAAGVTSLENLGCTVSLRPDLGPETIPGALSSTQAEILIVRSTKVPRDAIASAPTLKGIIRAGAGYDNIDHRAAGELGVSVCNCPGVNAVAVAELTIGHLIGLDRRLPEQDAALKSGKWDKEEFGKARGLKGRSLLVVGTGAIGTEVILRAKAFGMVIYGQDKIMRKEHARALGIEPIAYSREALYEALGMMDAVSIHVARTPDTEGLCGPKFFGAMKPGAYFLNTSRGQIVDEHALAEAVRTKGIRAALDVYQNQPALKHCDWETEIASVDGVHCSHHAGASTDQAQQAVGDEVVRIVSTYRESGRFLHVINAEALGAPTT